MDHEPIAAGPDKDSMTVGTPYEPSGRLANVRQVAYAAIERNGCEPDAIGIAGVAVSPSVPHEKAPAIRPPLGEVHWFRS